MLNVGQRAGVMQRHWARPDETAFDLAKSACDKLLRGDPGLMEGVDGLIFCTQSPDHIMPPNAHLLHAHLGLPDACAAFDINLACSGYIYGLAIAHGLLSTGIATKILLVTADTYSKFIHPDDRSARVLFGDAAAVSVLVPDAESGMSMFSLDSHGKEYAKFYIPAGGCRFPRSPETAKEFRDAKGRVRCDDFIQMDGMGVWSFINSAVPKQIRSHLDKFQMGVEDVDLFIFHQASQMTLDSLTRILKIPPAKTHNNIASVGNTVSASIPIALADAVRTRGLPLGRRILLSGFGVGLSYGSVLYDYKKEIHVY